jgi:hypothetical protein
VRFTSFPFHRARLLPFLLLIVLLCGALPATAKADSGPPSQVRGLLITPLRQYLKTAAGATIKSNLSVTNLTDKPLDVHLSVQQFSVTDYSYNYQFTQPNNDWLHLGLTDFSLQPHRSQTVSYQLVIPEHTAPGGHYYTLFASADLADQGINNTIQAADLLYLTVSGHLTYTNQLRMSSIGHFSFGQPFTYELDPVNTGNVYYFAYVSGQLHGLTAKPAATPESHLLMPGSVRRLTGTIAAPVLPGVYTATYGYRTDDGQNVQQSRTVIFIPPWSVAFLLAALLVLGAIIRSHHQSRRRRKAQAQAEAVDKTAKD